MKHELTKHDTQKVKIAAIYIYSSDKQGGACSEQTQLWLWFIPVTTRIALVHYPNLKSRLQSSQGYWRANLVTICTYRSVGEARSFAGRNGEAFLTAVIRFRDGPK